MNKLFNYLNTWQKVYSIGVVLIMLSTFFPWFVYRVGINETNMTQVSLWDLGISEFYILLFLFPAGMFIYSLYRDYINKSFSTFYKILLFSVFLLVTSSITLVCYMFFLIILPLVEKQALNLITLSNFIKPGIGLKISLVGCALVYIGFLQELKTALKKHK